MARARRASIELGLQDLREELSDLAARFPGLSENDRFVQWFLLAYLVDDENAAAEALVGVSHDKGVDVVVIDDRSRTVFLIQGKFRLSINERAEGRLEVVSFADLSVVMWGERDAYRHYTEGLDPLVRARLDEARDRLHRRDRYKLHLFYVTTGSCSTGLRTEAAAIARTAKGLTEFDVLDGRAVLGILRDYLDGVAPPVRLLDLPVQSTGRAAAGVSSRFDPSSGIESWVFTMSGREVAKLFDSTGIRLFARNIRGFLGGTGINQAMQVTLAERPEYFWYFNNGITIVCDAAEEITKRGRTILRVNNPQVINGQQTTRVLAAQADLALTASVLARVIRVPHDGESFDDLVSRIVEATNWQNQIRASDLVANDRRQVLLERELRKRGYQYLRKRQTKGEARAAAGSRFRFLVSKEELAQAVAACKFDPVIVRQGKEGLFQEQFYTSIFDDTTAPYYLDRYWLMRIVGNAASGYPERSYAKWVVLNFMWSKVGRPISSRSAVFEAACERGWRSEPFLSLLHTATDLAYAECLAFYRQSRGAGPHAIDVSNFFKRRNLHKEFARHWDQDASARRKARFDSTLARLQAQLASSQ